VNASLLEKLRAQATVVQYREFDIPVFYLRTQVFSSFWATERTRGIGGHEQKKKLIGWML